MAALSRTRLTAAMPHPARRPIRAFAVGLVATLAIGLAFVAAGNGPALASGPTEVRIAAAAPTSFDPKAQSDIGTAAITAQLYESLTAFDAGLVLRPALARAWDVSEDGRRVVFHLRDGLTFSDGRALTAADVVGTWLRLVDPDSPSPLASLMLDVKGARDYVSGRNPDPASVGLRADGGDVVVDLEQPGADFPAVVSSPSFGVVPPSVWRDGEAITGSDFVVSGAYVVTDVLPTEVVLHANPRYWAGAPTLNVVHLVADIGGRSPVAAFEAGDLDYVEISSSDASWIRYDETLGPQLRVVPSLSLTYLGFDTSRPPFDDVRVRQAFGAAVNWQRVAELGISSNEVPATSMVPPGVAGRGDGDWLPAHDPAAARRLLAEAGFPEGRDFPLVSFATGGAGLTAGIAADLERELGVTVQLEVHADHFTRLSVDPPAIWILGWIADYPGPNDFLGVLLGTGSSNNYGRWSSDDFDAAINEALSTRDPAAAQAGFERALTIVQRDVPAVPLVYGDSWALSRDGLLGAGQNGLGIVRMAGLAWAN
ncbi:MAG TPA: peptide ABC transporter substrate-binding protein [Candidatus Eisenbacteria bacterium]|nr:peptide ABC transporter substrate-binding protein [Candidatus Eisenbacteria bacterium]